MLLELQLLQVGALLGYSSEVMTRSASQIWAPRPTVKEVRNSLPRMSRRVWRNVIGADVLGDVPCYPLERSLRQKKVPESLVFPAGSKEVKPATFRTFVLGMHLQFKLGSPNLAECHNARAIATFRGGWLALPCVFGVDCCPIVTCPELF